jgi:sugar phosphate isomerase/epimerase
MLLTLNASSVRSMLRPSSRKGDARADGTALTLNDLPQYAREVLGLHGLNIPTDLLAGAERRTLDALRDRADKAGCAVLLLIETQPQPLGETNEAKAEAGVERLRRVVEAGAALGCSAIATAITGAATEDGKELAADRLREVAERAEIRDLNVLLAPAPGLTAKPETLTELIKAVGGFRVGTFPDFQQASKEADPQAYMRRLTPYAAAVSASTVAFGEPEAPPAPGKKGAALKKAEAPKPKGKGKKAAEPEPPPPPPPLEDEEDDEAELDLAELDPALAAEMDAEDAEPPPEPVAPHVAYDLNALVRAVVAVGYDGNVAIDYRGTGDVTLGLRRSRAAIHAALASVGLA